jgi:hypothetical protein
LFDVVPMTRLTVKSKGEVSGEGIGWVELIINNVRAGLACTRGTCPGTSFLYERTGVVAANDVVNIQLRGMADTFGGNSAYGYVDPTFTLDEESAKFYTLQFSPGITPSNSSPVPEPSTLLFAMAA